jgi:hypothetical protein
VEYYESIEDTKYKGYQNRLQMLLSQNDILNNMNENENKKNIHIEKENHLKNYGRKSKKLQERKKKIKQKVHYISRIKNLFEKESKIQNLMYTNLEDEKEAKLVLKEEITRQDDTFQARLLEKRKKQYSSGPKKEDKENILQNDINLSSIVTKMNEINLASSKSTDNLTNSGFVLIKKIAEENVEEQNGASNLPIINITSIDNYNGEISLENGKIDKIYEKVTLSDSLEHGASNGLININVNNLFNYEKNGSSFRILKVNENVNILIIFQILESKHFGPKQKQIFCEIKNTLDQFANEYNSNFFKYVFQLFAEKIQKLLEERYHKYEDISKLYHSQIKEIEYLLNEGLFFSYNFRFT